MHIGVAIKYKWQLFVKNLIGLQSPCSGLFGITGNCRISMEAYTVRQFVSPEVTSFHPGIPAKILQPSLTVRGNLGIQQETPKVCG